MKNTIHKNSLSRAVAILMAMCLWYPCSAQQAYERAPTIEGIRAIASATYPDHYLSIDNREFFGSRFGDQGIITVTPKIAKHELFAIKEIAEGIYTIALTDIKGRYLRMDGAQVKPQSKTLSGILNLQVYAGGYEKFRIEQQADGTYTIESVAFPGRYLHMSKDKVLVSGRVGEKERFHLLRKGGT